MTRNEEKKSLKNNLTLALILELGDKGIKTITVNVF